jgi:3-phenylpropionate/cinnamic acid dioxygenase small subunit
MSLVDSSAGQSAVSSEGEYVEYVTTDLYQQLSDSVAASLRRYESSSASVDWRAIERFLFWEARLLDFRQYRHWFSLLAEDFIYWVPGSDESRDPRREASINFDDRRRMLDRIVLIETGLQLAQKPPSRTCRLVSNVEAWNVGDGRLAVRSNLIISEFRRGQPTNYIGWQEHELIKGDIHWLIRRKIIHLINSAEPQGNNTFIF